MDMIIKTHIDDPSMIHKIESLLMSKKYTSEQNLILQAIRNLLVDEAEKSRRIGKNIGHIHPYSFKVELDRYYNAARRGDGFKEFRDFINHFKKKARFTSLGDTETIDHNSEIGQYTKTLRIDPGAAEKLYGRKSVGLIWYWHNRILPIKWLLRAILLYTIRKDGMESNVSHPPWIELADLRDHLEYERLPYINSLRNNESLEYEMKSRSTRVAHRDIFVGFPEIKEKFKVMTELSEHRQEKETVKQQAANKRFLDQFLGRAVRVKSGGKKDADSPRWIASGACFEMEFLTMKVVGIEMKKGIKWNNNIRNQISKYPLESNKSHGFDEVSYQVALTPTGVEFAFMENKLLDALEYGMFPDQHPPELLEIPKDTLVDEHGNKFQEIEVFSEKETKFIIEHFKTLERYSHESTIIDNLLAYSDPDNQQNTGGKITMDDYHKKIFDKVVRSDKQHKSSTINRLIELNLAYRTRKKNEKASGGKVTYVVQPINKVWKKRSY